MQPENLLKHSGISVGSAPKTYAVEQDKTCPPEQTVAWVRQRFAAAGHGILKQTVRSDTGRLGIPVYLSLCGPEVTRLTGNQKQMGKGASPAQAEASALMELAERFSFFHHVHCAPRPWLTAPQAPAPAMPVELAALAVGQAQVTEAERRIYDLLPQEWVMARNLAADREEAVPFGWMYAINEYNGPAAGNRQEEALVQALCELIERHVCALIWAGELQTPTIDPDSVDDPVSRDLLAKFAGCGVQVVLKDFSLDMGVPTVAALCWDPETFPAKSEIVYTAGTASSPAKALVRALTEVAQLAGDFIIGSNYKVSALPKFASLDDAHYVTAAPSTVPLADLPDVSAEDFGDEVRAITQALARRGFTAYALDVTHPDLQVPAVYCMVPGLWFAQRNQGTDLCFHAAKLASQLPDPERAEAVLAAMAAQGPERYYLSFFHALALLNLDRAEEALPELEKALTLEPPAHEVSAIHTHLGVAHREVGDLEAAKRALAQATQGPEVHSEVYNLLGACHYGLAEYDEAIGAFERAIELEPGQALNYANIGSCLRNQGQIKEACRLYEHALELDPDLDWVRGNLEKLRQEPTA